MNKIVLAGLVGAVMGVGQSRATLPPLPKPLAVPAPGAVTDGPYAPTEILPGGVVVTLFPPGSPYLKAERVREAEHYTMSQTTSRQAVS